MNGNRSCCLTSLLIGYQDQPIFVSSNDHHALCGNIQVSFFREPDDLFDYSKIKASYLSPVPQVVGPYYHSHLPAMRHPIEKDIS